MLKLQATPFSRYGSLLSVAWEGAGKPLTIHQAYRHCGGDLIYSLDFCQHGEPIPFTVDIQPWALRINAAGGHADLVLADDFTLLIDAVGLECRLTFLGAYAYGVSETGPRHKVLVYPVNLYLAIDALIGVTRAGGPDEERPGNVVRDRRCNLTVLAAADGHCQVRFMASREEPHPGRCVAPLSIQPLLDAVRQEWTSFQSTLPAPPASYRESAEWSWYSLWSCTLRAQGQYRFDAVLMSRKFMTSVWSWDHCFNALALGLIGPRGALEQFLLPFQAQLKSGVLPDNLDAFAEPRYCITKPPIHGWCFGKLLDRYTFSDGVLRDVLEKLTNWTNWWMEYRDADLDGLPEYPLALDSGWDNTTLLEPDFFIAAPDLAAYLILQMRLLSRLNILLKDAAGAERWARKADALRERMIGCLWAGDGFVARRCHSHETIKPRSSLMTVMPLILGPELPESVQSVLIQRLESEFLTPYGLATEAPGSPYYEADGYWLGPIWAPTTYLLVDGLARSGRRDLAEAIARRFCDMVQNTAQGCYENFDALSGAGLRAPGYTWTSSVQLLLMHEYLK